MTCFSFLIVPTVGLQTHRPPLETVGPKMSQVAMNFAMLAMMNKNYWDAVNNVEGDEIAVYAMKGRR